MMISAVDLRKVHTLKQSYKSPPTHFCSTFQKVNIALTNVYFHKKIQGFFEILKITPFQNDW